MKKRTAKQKPMMMDLTPTWADIIFELRRALRFGPDLSLTAEEKEANFWGPIFENLERMAKGADKWNAHCKAQKGSLFQRISPEELAAEGLVLMPKALLREGQIGELAAWLRKDATKANAEADALEEEGKRRENVVRIKSA
jgi:hypothetical protein